MEKETCGYRKRPLAVAQQPDPKHTPGLASVLERERYECYQHTICHIWTAEKETPFSKNDALFVNRMVAYVALESRK